MSIVGLYYKCYEYVTGKSVRAGSLLCMQNSAAYGAGLWGRGKASIRVGTRMLMVRCPDFVRSSRDEIDDERLRAKLLTGRRLPWRWCRVYVPANELA
jgi:hypothetical protein